jgi:hypothetical protein
MGLCQSRNHSSGVAAHDAKTLPSDITQVTIEYVQRRYQPRSPSLARRGHERRVEHEER